MKLSGAVLLTLTLALPSIDVIHRYTGILGLSLYLPIVLALVLGAGKLHLWLQQQGSRRFYYGIAAAFLLIISAAFFIVFPIADVQTPGQGSDTDEAYDLAVLALMDGRYPYYDHTYLDNAIHHLPGALLLATPFVLLGSSALQNLFWVAAYLVVLVKLLRWPGALTLFALQFVACPVLMQQIVTGNDGVMSGISIFVAAWIFCSAWQHHSTSGLWRHGSLLLLAIALSNRPNFAPIIITAIAYVGYRQGAARAIAAAMASSAWLMLINLPFYLYDKSSFSPLEGLDRVSRFNTLLPHAGQLLPLAAFALAAVLAADARTFSRFVLGIGIPQAFLVAIGMALSSIAAGSMATSYAGYGTYFLFPLGFLLWKSLIQSHVTEQFGQESP